MRSIGQNIKSCKRPFVRLSIRSASVDKIATLFMDRSLPNLEHSFPVSYRRKYFLSSTIQSSIRACATINRLSLTAVHVLHKRLMLSSKLSYFCVDYFNKLAELVFVTVFNTHVRRKKLTKRQKFKKQTISDRRTKRCAGKKFNCVPILSYATLNFYLRFA